MANFSCFLMMFQHQKIDENWAPNSRAFHAVGGPFTQWEVLFTDFHGDSRVFCAHPTFGAESREANIYYVLQFALYSLKIHICFCTFQLCFAVCSLFSVLFCFLVMFVFGFAVCSLFYVKFIYVPVCFCYVSQLAPYFPFHVLFHVLLLLFFAVCSLFYVKYMYVSVCVCYVSQFALYFLFYLCFLLCVCFVSQCVPYFLFYVLFSAMFLLFFTCFILFDFFCLFYAVFISFFC